MAIYVGEGVVITLVVTDPLLDIPITSGITVALTFYSPPKNPSTTPADRTPDHGPVSMTFDSTVVNADSTTGAWKATVDTTGWEAGKTWYQAEVSGAYNAWIYGSFKLVA